MLLDESTEGTDRFLIGLVGGQLWSQARESAEGFRAGLHSRLEMPVGGREWVALFRPTSEPVPVYPWAVLAGGISLTGMGMMLLYSAQQRTLTVQRLVRERTAELHATCRYRWDPGDCGTER